MCEEDKKEVPKKRDCGEENVHKKNLGKRNWESGSINQFNFLWGRVQSLFFQSRGGRGGWGIWSNFVLAEVGTTLSEQIKFEG